MKQMNMFKILLPLGFVLFVIMIYYLSPYVSNIGEDYPLIKRNENVFRKIDKSKAYQSVTFFIDIDGNKFSVFSNRLDKKGKLLYYYLEVGDSISRKAYCDTLFLHKKMSGEILEFDIECMQ